MKEKLLSVSVKLQAKFILKWKEYYEMWLCLEEGNVRTIFRLNLLKSDYFLLQATRNVVSNSLLHQKIKIVSPKQSSPEIL